MSFWVFGRRLQFVLASDGVSVVIGRFAGGGHVARAHMLCARYGVPAVADKQDR